MEPRFLETDWHIGTLAGRTRQGNLGRAGQTRLASSQGGRRLGTSQLYCTGDMSCRRIKVICHLADHAWDGGKVWSCRPSGRYSSCPIPGSGGFGW